MTPLELRLRAEVVTDLLAQADMASDDKARRKRREADKALTAMSLSAYLAEQGRLLSAMDEARNAGGDYAVAALTDELRRLERENPEPWERLAGVLLEAANTEIERQAAANRPRWFVRFFRSK